MLDAETAEVGVHSSPGQFSSGHRHVYNHQHSTASNQSIEVFQSVQASPSQSMESGASINPGRVRDESTSDRFSRQSSKDFQQSPLSIPINNEVTALRKHIKILEERLRNERHTHAVKFSEVEKQLIQENAKLKVSTSALQRQVKREQQLVQDHETELSILRKNERKAKFSFSGLARSFSDAKLEDIEMKDRSLKREELAHEPEVVEMLKQRLSDSEKDRMEAEALFNQRLSGLLRERNLQRAEMRSAEETIMRLNRENEASNKSVDELRLHIANSLVPSRDSTPLPINNDQVNLLRRANQHLRSELDLLTKEKTKLLSELELLSEELSLSKANERQNQQQNNLAGEMKDRIDTLRNQLASLERKKVSETSNGFLSRETSFSTESINSVISADNRPGPSGPHRTSSVQRKNLELDNRTAQLQQQLADANRKLAGILELSQRYERHCYQLEKELFQIYGKNYKFESTEWRQKDTKLIKTLESTVKRKPQESVELPSIQPLRKVATISSMTQTTLPATEPSRNRNSDNDTVLENLTEKVTGMVRMLERLSPKNSPLSTHRNNFEGKAIAAAFDDLLRAIREGQSSNTVDLTKLTEARLEIQTLQRAFRVLEEKNASMEQEMEQLRNEVAEYSDDEGVGPVRPITQAEIDERIARAQIRAQQLQAAGLLQNMPVFGATNPFVAAESTTTNYTSQTSGIWASPWSSGSSRNGAVEHFYTPETRPRAATVL